MKGIILAAGLGKRLMPLTACTPKALLPMGDDFLIAQSINLLKRDSIIEEICVVVSPQHATQFMLALGDGYRYGTKITYQVQHEPNGIAGALKTCEKWAKGYNIVVTLADTIFMPWKQFDFRWKRGATCYSYRVQDPYWCGCVERGPGGVVTQIVEKPGPGYDKSNEVLIGLYEYDQSVWQRLDRLTPSARGELEITDLNNDYLRTRELEVVEFAGLWHDAGTDLEAYVSGWEVGK